MISPRQFRLSDFRASSWARRAKLAGVSLGLLGISSLSGCWRPPPQSDPDALRSVESRLQLNDVTLEEPDRNGKTLWKIDAKQVTYSPDRKTATVTLPQGVLFQDGKPQYRFTAKRGEILQKQPFIRLSEDVVMTELSSKTILKSSIVEWQPNEGLFVMPKPLTITHKKLQASANQGQVFSREQRAELRNNVVAQTTDPQMKLVTQQLNWLMESQQLTSSVRVQVEHFQDNQVRDRGWGDRFTADQKQKTVLLEKNARIELQTPPLDIRSESLLWDLQARKVTSPVPLAIHHRQENISIQAQQGWVDLPRQIYYLTGNVRGQGQRQQATFSSEKFTWFIQPNEFLAEGNFVYRQQNPQFSSRSPMAEGEFEDQYVVLKSRQDRVETEIIPASP